MDAPDAHAAPSPVRARTGSLPLGVLAGLVAAVAGGIVWALVVNWTGYEIGIAAWGIGLLTGTAVVFSTRGGKGLVLQAVAVACALLGILLGKYLGYAFEIQDQADEVGVSIGLFSSEMRTFFREDLDQVFGLFDLLWVGLAVYTAWRVPQPEATAPAQPQT